jgi:hypothetical protein
MPQICDMGHDGFYFPSEEGVLRIFSPWKIRRLRPGLNPRTWVPKASTLPLDHRSRFKGTDRGPWFNILTDLVQYVDTFQFMLFLPLQMINNNNDMTFCFLQDLRFPSVLLKILIFWDFMVYRLVSSYWCFQVSDLLLLQSQAVLVWPCRTSLYNSFIHLPVFTGRHGVKLQKA